VDVAVDCTRGAEDVAGDSKGREGRRALKADAHVEVVCYGRRGREREVRVGGTTSMLSSMGRTRDVASDCEGRQSSTSGDEQVSLRGKSGADGIAVEEDGGWQGSGRGGVKGMQR
jgi:hypothetical protein